MVRPFQTRLTTLTDTFCGHSFQVINPIVGLRQVAQLQAWRLRDIEDALHGVDALINHPGMTTWGLFSEMTYTDINALLPNTLKT